ncbi:flagellar type III secretion system protein FlhB [Pararhodobacter sp. SW119]|uniref:EscU/YscU/HrcU family type III secretion system export apparatus switch protein n=1 Tax=Pararhodobacter sp. SW119 TaxID=2780075 RepID=UPI001AE0BD53|nr:flagellar type III secretion system protein FlhB [Pararhodobacter sp. SW119]
MSQGDDESDKPYEATPRKLEEARKRGEIPKMADLTATAAVGGFLLLALLPGGWMPLKLGELGRGLFDYADGFSRLLLGGGQGAFDLLMGQIAIALLPAFLLPVAAVLGVLLAFRGLVFAPEKLKPKASRLSIVQNAKQKFGLSGLFEFAKSTVKLVIYAAVLWMFLAARLPRLMATMQQSPGQVVAEMMRLVVEFLVIVVLIMALIGAIDFFWQRYDHLRRQRMSHQELREEYKQSEGDPHMKQARRQRAQEIATNKMLIEVPKADVIIVNPTHFAVALKWDRSSPGAPVCVAKGVDQVALKIRELAQDAGVPIHSDPPTARALHSGVEIGQEIAPEHYAPVAAAIRFAEAMRLKARGRGFGPRDDRR